MSFYVGEIRIFAGTFAPQEWHFCDGAMLKVADYPGLSVVLGTRFGGDGQTRFGIPDLRGRVVIGGGQGAGLSPRALGSYGGSSKTKLTAQHMPKHTHQFMTAGVDASTPTFGETVMFANTKAPNVQYLKNSAIATAAKQHIANDTVRATGGDAEHSNMMPTMTLNYIIALVGHFPQF